MTYRHLKKVKNRYTRYFIYWLLFLLIFLLVSLIFPQLTSTWVLAMALSIQPLVNNALKEYSITKVVLTMMVVIIPVSAITTLTTFDGGVFMHALSIGILFTISLSLHAVIFLPEKKQ